LPVLLVAIDGTNGKKLSGDAMKKLAQNARQLEYNYHYGGNEAKDAWYLQGYSLKMLSCQKGEQAYNYRENTVEPSTVIFRLCPSETCNSNTTSPCDQGYGDFSVGINTFAQAYIESVKDDYNNGMQYYSYDYGEFNVEEYTRECKLFEEDGGNNNNNNQNYQNYENGSYGYSYDYIGLTCTDDGTDIRMTSFSDPYCTTESEASFESTHNNYSLPFSTGGMIPSTCLSCVTTNDNYETELSQLCEQVYENANYKCEQKMEYTNYYYGPDNRGCDYLDSYVPKSSKKSSTASESSFTVSKFSGAGTVVGYFFLLLVSGVVGAAAAFTIFQKFLGGAKSVEEPNPIIESIKSGAMLVKLQVLAAYAKISAMIAKPEPEGDYSNMDDEKKESTTGPAEEEC